MFLTVRDNMFIPVKAQACFKMSVGPNTAFSRKQMLFDY